MVLLSVFYCSGCGRPGIPISLSIIYGNSPYFKGFAEILTAKASLFSQSPCPLPGFLQAQAGVQGQGAVGVPAARGSSHRRLARQTPLFSQSPCPLPGFLQAQAGVQGQGAVGEQETAHPQLSRRPGSGAVAACRGKAPLSHRVPVPCPAFSRHRLGSRVRVPSGNRKQGTPSFPAARAGPSSARVSRRRRNSFRTLVLSVISTYR